MAGGQPLNSYDDLTAQARAQGGFRSLLLIPPLMHGAAQWGVFNTISTGGWIALPDDVKRLDAAAVLRLAERERVLGIPVVGDAMARPLVDEIEKGDYDLSGLMALTNGGATLSPTIRDRLLAALPNLLIMDAVGASESGAQMTTVATKGAEVKPATFTPLDDTTVVSSDFSRVLEPGEPAGWLARREFVPLGYLGDAEKTARTFPTINGVRWSIPGDKARLLEDGRIELLGRDSVTINSGGEKIFAEEVERAVASHPAIYDVVVTGRPSERWGSEVVAVVQFAQGKTATDEELADACRRHVADYKVPKAFVRTDTIVRSPAGKADYRWAKAVVSAATPI
jgi:fatty-acyl-CoA synthase